MAPNTNASTSIPSTAPSINADVVVSHFFQAFDSIQSRFTEPGLDLFETHGKTLLAKSIRDFVDRSEPLQLVLPAFPFKSPNRGGKVLGVLPDRGEELALERLENFCKSIEAVYPIGCTVTIFSDGRVFNDLLGVPNENLVAYKVELREMVKDAGHTHILFDGLEHHTKTDDPIREVLERFQVEAMDMNAMIKEDAGLLNTYRSFRKFLTKDLAPQWVGMSSNQVSKRVGEIAKLMMHRNVGFSTLVDATYPRAIRLSIHLYNNAGPKYGIHLTPHTESTVSQPRTPWHSVMCEDADGFVHKVDVDSVDMDKYELVEKRGRPWGFRERVSATVPQDDKNAKEEAPWKSLNVTFIREPLALIIQANDVATPPSMLDVPVESLRALTTEYGVVSLRGFKQTDDLVEVSERIGPVLDWPAFGKVFEIKSVVDTALTGQTLEAMSMHYDGMFKKKHPDSTELGDVWLYQLFHCVEAYPSEDESEANGRTLFAHTVSILEDLTEVERERLRKTTLVYNTGLFNQAHLMHTSPVIIKHPVTGQEVLRYHEPWGPERTKMFTTTVTSVGVDVDKVLSGEVKDEDADWVANLLVDKLYDPKYCYSHAWSKGEFVISDNIKLVHARTAMKADGRYVRRVHIN